MATEPIRFDQQTVKIKFCPMRPAIYYAPHQSVVEGNEAYAISPLAGIPYPLHGFCWGGGEWFGEEAILKQLELVHGLKLTKIPIWFPVNDNSGKPYNRWCCIYDKERKVGEWVGGWAAPYNPKAAALLARFYADYDHEANK